MYRLSRHALFVLPAVLLVTGPASAQEPAEPAPPPGVEVQPRGPVHEAFARPADAPPTAGPAVAAEPPAPVPEVPPDQKPDDPNAQWVPGYWSWDDEGNRFIWISGCWRVPPPGRQWVAGSWQKADTGWTRQAGFWADAAGTAQQVPSAPPPSLDVGPSTPQPGDDSYYTPGQWVFRDGTWVWQPGTWVENPGGMVYVPPTYVPSGNGVNVVNGYWDYPLDSRGMLFAPVAFAGTPWVGNPGWCYQPSYAVGYGGLLGSLFTRPGYGGYYFGNYFGPSYQTRGYVPWTNYARRGYDPLLNYYRWANRSNPGWYGNLNGLYAGRQNGSLPAPAVRYGTATTGGYAPNVANRYAVNFGRVGTVTPVNSLRTVHHVSTLHGRPVTQANPVVRPAYTAPAVSAAQRAVAQPRMLSAPGVVPHQAHYTPQATVPHVTAQPRTLTAPNVVPHQSHYAPRVSVPQASVPHAVPQFRAAAPPVAVPHRGQAFHAAPAAPRVHVAPQAAHAAPQVRHVPPAAHAAPRAMPAAPRAAPAPHGGGHAGGHRR